MVNVIEASADVKIPPSCVLHHRLFFAHMEAIFRFHTLSVSNVLTFSTVLFRRGSRGSVCDSINEILVVNFCDVVKGQIVKSTGLSDHQPLDKVFANVEIGGRKISELFRIMRQILRPHEIDDSLLRLYRCRNFLL